MAENFQLDQYDQSFPPIVSKRSPTTRDRAELGTLWVNTVLNDAFILTSVASGVSSWINAGGGSGTFSALNINPGNATITSGNLVVTAGSITVGGAINFTSFGKGVLFSSAAGVITSSGGTNGQVIIGKTGDAPLWATLTAGAGIGIVNAANAITISAPGATAVSYVTDVAGPVLPDGGGAVNVVGGSNITTDGTVANTITIDLDNTISVSGKITAGNDFQMTTGTCLIASDDNAANAIYLHANGGVNETIHAYSQLGTSVNSIFLESLVGGVTIDAGLSAANAIHLHASGAAGGLSMAAGTNGTTITNTNGVFTVVTGTGNISIGADAAQHNCTLGSIVGTSGVIIQSGTGDVAITSTDEITATSTGVVDVNAGGAIELQTTGALVNIATDAVAATVTIGNTTGISSVIIDTGTGNVDLGVSATVHTTRLGSTTGASATTVQCGSGALTINGGGIMDLDAVGALSINSSGAAINIGNDAAAFGINVGTGGAQRNIIVGNATGTTSVVVNGGTGNMYFGQNATDHTTTVGSVTGVSNSSLLSGTGLLNLASLGSATFSAVTTLDIDTAGALSINSSAGIINVGNDAVAQAINIGTGGAQRNIIIGNATGTTSFVINAGTGVVQLGANAIEHATTIGSVTTASATTIQGGTGGIAINAAGIVTMLPATDSQAATAITINANVGHGVFTGLTTAAAAEEILVINNTKCTVNSAILCTIANKGANVAKMGIVRVEPKANSFEVTVHNFAAAAALNGNIVLTFWIIA